MERSAAETRDLFARLKYLHKAAHVLALASPETSSFLESQYGHLLAENEQAAPDSRRREVCGACGTILISGLSCSVTQEMAQPGRPRKTSSKVEKREASNRGKDSRTKIYSCLRCSSRTLLQIPTSKARMNTRKSENALARDTSIPVVAASAQTAAAKSSAATSIAQAPTPAPAVGNANSKKRTKARKGGLQALLANSKKDTSSSKGFGLDLMDLMRSD